MSKHKLYGIFIILLYYKNKTSHHRKNLKSRKSILEIILYLSLFHLFIQLIFIEHTYPALSNSANTHAESCGGYFISQCYIQLYFTYKNNHSPRFFITFFPWFHNFPMCYSLRTYMIAIFQILL